MIKMILTAIVLLAMPVAHLLAQEGPYVPCVGCDILTQAPFPEAGSWYNPDQSGTGINLEIQNGFLVAFYYGYTVEGIPEWQIIRGPLVRSEQEGVLWERSGFMKYYQDGNCIGCAYVPPLGPVNGLAVKLEFLQRNYLRITIGENPAQYYVPIMYGSGGMKYFEDQTPYVFPEYGADFVLITKPNTDPPSPWEWESQVLPVLEARMSQGKLTYWSAPYQPPPGADVFFDLIVCEIDLVSDQPGRKIFLGGKEYSMPIGNMSDSRFFGEAEDGSTIEGFRLNYD